MEAAVVRVRRRSSPHRGISLRVATAITASERRSRVARLATPSAERNDLDVFPFVKDVLGRLLNGDADYESLHPDVWKAAHPEAVWVYRVEERRSRAEAQSIKRARRRLAKKR